MKRLLQLGILAAALVAAGAARAEPSITGVTASVQQKELDKTTVKIVINGKGLENAICALRVNQGDGTSVVHKMDWSTPAKFPLVINKTYSKPGSYPISVRGIKSGMYLKCLGSARTSIKVE